jgi:hypothetical protein
MLAEAFSSLAAKGTVVSQGFPRLDLGSNSVYGLVLIVDEKGGRSRHLRCLFQFGQALYHAAIAP